MVEFGPSQQLTDIVAVTDVRMERILRRAGWPMRRIGNPSKIGDTLAAAGYLAIPIEVLACLRGTGALSAPVLWTPAILCGDARRTVQQVGEPLDLYHCPANRFVASFIGSPAMNFATVKLNRTDGGLWAMNENRTNPRHFAQHRSLLFKQR